MPNPKVGTVTDDIEKAVEEAKAGKIEYRTDKQAIVHLSIGKTSFEAEALLENYAAVIEEIIRAKPAAAKGRYILTATLTNTMGPGIRVDTAKTRARRDHGRRRPRSRATGRATARTRPRSGPEQPPARRSEAEEAGDRLDCRSQLPPETTGGVAQAQKTGAGGARSTLFEPACVRALSSRRTRLEQGTENSRSRGADRGAEGARRRSSRSTTAGSACRRPPSCAPACARPTPASGSSRTGSPCSPPTPPAPTEIKEHLERPDRARPWSTATSRSPPRRSRKLGDEWELLEYKGGIMDGEALDADSFKAIAKLPGRDQLERPVRRHRRQPAHRPRPRPRLDGPGPRAASCSRSPTRASSPARPPGRSAGGARRGRGPGGSAEEATRRGRRRRGRDGRAGDPDPEPERVARGGALRGDGARGRGRRRRAGPADRRGRRRARATRRTTSGAPDDEG